ncbi:MAG: hypothetical protein K9M99_07240 [Candidatus Cloacimonetes bacterium]|nr:hypothetical protein [Candidatus Cloacimonadota bacterium]
MKATLVTPYRTVTGRDGEKVAYGWHDLDVTFLCQYTVPDNPTGEAAFASKTTAVIDTWKDASEGFINDIITYTQAWNETQLDGRTQIPYNKLNIFLKACFAVAKLSAFDISTLTVDNFGGEAGDLLGTAEPNVGNLITAAGMPACGLDLETLDSSIETV